MTPATPPLSPYFCDECRRESTHEELQKGGFITFSKPYTEEGREEELLAHVECPHCGHPGLWSELSDKVNERKGRSEE